MTLDTQSFILGDHHYYPHCKPSSSHLHVIISYTNSLHKGATMSTLYLQLNHIKKSQSSRSEFQIQFTLSWSRRKQHCSTSCLACSVGAVTRYDSGRNAGSSSNGSEREASAAVAGYDDSEAAGLTDPIGSWTGWDEGDKTGEGEEDFGEMHARRLLARGESVRLCVIVGLFLGWLWGRLPLSKFAAQMI